MRIENRCVTSLTPSGAEARRGIAQFAMRQRWQLRSHLRNARRVQLSGDNALTLGQHRDHFPPRVYHHAVPPGAAAVFVAATLGGGAIT